MALINDNNTKYTVYRTKKDDSLLKRIKVRAAQEGIDIIDLTEIALREYLKAPIKKD